MRHLLIAACAVLVLSAAVDVHGSGNVYVGVYADDDHSEWCVDGEPSYEIDVWIWILTTEEGMNGFGYNLNIPETYSLIDKEYHPFMIPEIVDPHEIPPSPHWSYRGALHMCKGLEWVWTYHLHLSIPDGTPGVIEVTSHPELGESVISDCSNVPHPLVRLTNLYVNYPPSSPECLTFGVEGSSWGAIKSLSEW